MKCFVAFAITILISPVFLQAQDADLQKIKGKWNLESLNVNGKEIPKEQLKTAKLQAEFDGDKLYRYNAGQRLDEATIKLDSTKMPNKHLDTTNKQGVTELGIYKISDDGKLLTICTRTESGKPRPEEFKANDDKTVLTTWTKVE